MIPRSDIEREVYAYYEQRENEVVDMDHAIAAIIASHAKPLGADADWWETNGWVGLWYVCGAVNRKIKAEENGITVEESELFPGYKRLQKRYSVVRENRTLLVPVRELTLDEFNLKIDEHRAMAAGHELHAQELERMRDGLFVN